MAPGSVVPLPTSVELMELVGRIGGGMKEGLRELFGVLIIRGEDRIVREWSEGDVDDSQIGGWDF